MKDQCKQAVAQALEKSTLTQQEAKKIEQRINEAMRNRAKQDLQAWRNLSLSERLKEAADQVAIDIKADLIRKREIVASDIVTNSISPSKKSKSLISILDTFLPS